MTNSGDAAEQIVRMSLEGTEVALKLTGSAAKNIAAALYTIAKNADRNKTKGHQRLSAMLKSGKELKVFTISEEHLKRFAQEARLLAVHRIDTAEQLSSYQGELESRIAAASAEQKQLYRKKRSVSVKSDTAKLTEIQSSISSLSKELSQLRREVKLCSDIAVRSGILPERIQKVREDENHQRKEKTEHDQFRRCGRTNR